jgi:hypothetical protein
MKDLNRLKGKLLSEEIDRIMEIMESTSPEMDVDESSLSRVWSLSEKFDVAIISASRGKKDHCLKSMDDKEEGEEYSKDENYQRTKELQSILLHKNYGVQKIKGSYIENFQQHTAREVQEASFFVVNRMDDPNFLNNIIRYGKYFCQDSVLLKPSGEEAYLYGTNNTDFPGLDQTSHLGKFKGGDTSEFMSRVGKTKRPFTFGEDFNTLSRGLISKTARPILEQIEKLYP